MIYPYPLWAPARVEQRWQPLDLGPPPEHGGHYLAVTDLIDAIEHGREPVCSGSDGVKALEMVLAPYAAQITGARVALPMADRRHPLDVWRGEVGSVADTGCIECRSSRPAALLLAHMCRYGCRAPAGRHALSARRGFTGAVSLSRRRPKLADPASSMAVSNARHRRKLRGLRPADWPAPGAAEWSGGPSSESSDARNTDVQVTVTEIGNILTRSSGFLRTVSSHSAQPYRGCPFGNALCGAGCYVRHNGHVTRGRAWGSFLEVRDNAAASYRAAVSRERRWARRARGAFSIFLSSSTEPFPPQEARYGVTRRLLEAMAEEPPDLLIVQTHSHQVTRYRDLLRELQRHCQLRVHLSIETDRERLPGLPPHASPIEQRFRAAAELKTSGIETVITVAPLLPIADPEGFFSRIAASADAVVIDHYIGGDGSANGSRTERTSLPAAMAAVDPDSVGLGYRDRMVRVAERHLSGRVGINIDGFAGRYL